MATLKDVAAKAGVTVTTVSRILNNRGYIGEETRAKVYAAMQELHYQPNEIARSLSKKTNRTIGIIVPHVEHPYFAKLIGCLEKEAVRNQHKVILCNSQGKFHKEKDYLEMFESYRVAGIVLCSNSVDIEKLLSMNIPVVSIERQMNASVANIECDNYGGGALAAMHLIEKGCKQLLHFSGIENECMPADDRLEGFASVCRAHNRQYIEVKSEYDHYLKMDYHKLIERALLDYPQVDGIFASSDLIAAQVIQVAHRLKRSIPDQLKIVGFDDVNIASLTYPSLTTIHQPVEEMAKEAIRCMSIDGKKKEVLPVKKFSVTLIQRETT